MDVGFIILIGVFALLIIGSSMESRKKDRSKWRGLRKGMSPSAVQQHIGEPGSVQVDGPLTTFKYAMGGTVVFVDDQLTSWKEPKF